jgi:plastocyanin domain-containing protein
VPIHVVKEGYRPDKITARPGEKLELVFTRVEDTACGEQIKVADGKVLDLPLNQPVKVPLTMPESGEVRFACGMDMMTGVVVVDSAAKI